jgi:hypothetical protein
MQTKDAMTAIWGAFEFLGRHPVWTGAGALLLVSVLVLLIVCRWKLRPRDLTGNGIAIGHAKAFDSSSLTLRLQRLNAGLEALKVVNQNITDNLSAVQERTSSEASRKLSLKNKQPATKSATEGDGKKDGSVDAKSSTATQDAKTTIGLGAGDALTNQLNLASQIFNLQTVYEGSLSDRMTGNESRLQTVLGFQVSISPPAGYEDCVAIVEIAVRTKEIAAQAPALAVPPVSAAPAAVASLLGAPVAPGVAAAPAAPAQPRVPTMPVSLVALMPQEKTYNAQSTTSVERSMDGSATVKLLTLGLGARRAFQGAFIRRDPETVAFERKAGEGPQLLDQATTFGWEFRPELGRRAVSPGPRQLMAVIALPAGDGSDQSEALLEIKTRSYWRRYDRKRQTSAPALSWLPWRIDRSGVFTSQVQQLPIPNTAKIQETLAASVSAVDWADAGGGKAYVKVTGRNFFTGTKVLIGGQTKQEKDGTLTLKSEQVLEFEAPLEAIAKGDALVIGRYGKSTVLESGSARPVHALGIENASIRPMRNAKVLRLTVDIVGKDTSGNRQPFTRANLSKLPDPILFVGNEPVPGPYDFSDQASNPDTPLNVLRVEAWISASALAKSREVTFRIPFCGLDYYINQPMAFSEPTVTRMGSDAVNTVFRIYFPQVFASQGVNVELDRTYNPNDAALVSMGMSTSGASEYRFTVPNELISSYQNMVVRVGKGEPYVIPIPPEDRPPVKAAIDANAAPALLNKGEPGAVEWQGTGLETIKTITFTPAMTADPTPGASPPPVAQDFQAYSGGTRLLVFLSNEVAAQEGKITLDCTTESGAPLKIPLFVLERVLWLGGQGTSCDLPAPSIQTGITTGRETGRG